MFLMPFMSCRSCHSCFVAHVTHAKNFAHVSSCFMAHVTRAMNFAHASSCHDTHAMNFAHASSCFMAHVTRAMNFVHVSSRHAAHVMPLMKKCVLAHVMPLMLLMLAARAPHAAHVCSCDVSSCDFQTYHVSSCTFHTFHVSSCHVWLMPSSFKLMSCLAHVSSCHAGHAHPCFFGLNSKVKWCLLLYDFVPENDFRSPLRIFFCNFRIFGGCFFGVCVRCL